MANAWVDSRYGFGTEVDASLDEAIERTKAALKNEGFGVLTTIDVRETLREKLDVEFEPYVILGACNPNLALRALRADHDVGLLLPCNVIVHQHGPRTVVTAVDPQAMLSAAPPSLELTAVAAEAEEKLRRAIAALNAEE
jgi:uncharacterized protein (DUF302 family)